MVLRRPKEPPTAHRCSLSYDSNHKIGGATLISGFPASVHTYVRLSCTSKRKFSARRVRSWDREEEIDVNPSTRIFFDLSGIQSITSSIAPNLIYQYSYDRTPK